MTTKMLEKTQLQTDLFAEFIAAWQNGQRCSLRIAQAYKGCIDAGMDLSRFVRSKSLALRLIKLAEGKLLPEAYDKTLGNDAMVVTLVALPVETQKRLVEEGVPVWRGKPEVVPVEDVSSSEARRLIDPVTKRLLPPQEQAARQTAAPVARHDMPVAFNLSREDYNDIAVQAKRARQSVPVFILAELVKAGVLSKGKKAA